MANTKSADLLTKLDTALLSLPNLTSLEKAAVRGAVTEIYFKLYHYLYTYNPNSSIATDIAKSILTTISPLQKIDLQELEHLLRAFNSKVPAECAINSTVVLTAVQSLTEKKSA